jgi:peptidoglycan/LPS O-acetylase OafA/YrhL
MMDWASPSGIKRNNFDSLRLVLAVVVIYVHSYLATGDLAAAAIPKTFAYWLSYGGNLVLDGFFAISGFLITQSWSSTPDLRRYLAKRGRRILPAYLLGMLLTAVLFAPLGAHPWHAAFTPTQIAHVIKRVVLLQRYPGSPAIYGANPFPWEVNVSMWTIQFEFWCYVLVAVAGITGLLGGKSGCLALFAAIIAGLAFQQFHGFDALHGWLARKAYGLGEMFFVGKLTEWPRVLAYFWAGATFYCWRTSIPRSAALAGLACVAIVLGGRFTPLQLALPIAAPYLLFWIAYEPALHIENFGRHGDFSYGTYLYAFPLQQLLVHWMPGIRPLTLFALCTPLAIAAGVISWHAVERRFLMRRRQAANPPAQPVIAEPAIEVPRRAA